MNKDRRNFLEDLIAAGFVTGAMSLPVIGKTSIESLVNESLASALDVPEDDAHKFWNSFFDYLGPATKGPKPPLLAPNRKVQYLHCDENKGLRYLNDVKSAELLDFDGDVLVTAELGQFRPSTDDQKTVAQVKSSSLRVDFLQTQSFMNLLVPMAWAALAVFAHDKASKLPTPANLGYQKNFMDGKVLLPGGSGKFALNVFPLKPESTLHKIISLVVPALLAAAPVLNLPAISIPVLKAVTQMYLGPKEEESYGKPLMNSLPMEWCATRGAYSASLLAEKFPLIDGNYVMIPRDHAEELGSSFAKLKWEQGYLVSQDAAKSDSPDQRAEKAIPGVTYVTMKMKVTKVPVGGARTG